MTFRAALVVGATAVLATGCINQDKSAATFCERNAQLLATSLDEQLIPKVLADNKIDRRVNSEVIEKVENGLSKSMRHSEDATKAIRNRARDLDGAYLDLLTTYRDTDAKQEQLDRDRAALEVEFARMKEACAAVSGQSGQ